MQLIESGPLADKRNEVIAEMKKSQSFVPDSATKGKTIRRVEMEAPAELADANPRHKEDFTSLLSAAAQKKPQGG